MKKIALFVSIGMSSLGLSGCIGCYNPTGCSRDTSPYYTTTSSTLVRGITVPAQTKLIYKSQNYFQKEQQPTALKEKNLTDIKLPADKAIVWGGMPSSMFIQFFNSEMKGFSVYPAEDFVPESSSDFIKLWQSCASDLDVTLKNTNDWSFNPENMEIRGCGVNIQKRSQYNDHWPNQDEADAFLIKINQALQKLPKQKSYPVLSTPSNK